MRGSIQKRNPGSWRLVYDVGRDHVGRRRQKTVTFKGTKRGAEKALVRLIAEHENGGFVDSANITVAEYLDRWLKYVVTKISPKTYERYEEIVRLSLVPHLGQTSLAKLRPMDVQAFYSEALKSGHMRHDGGLSARTVLHYHRILSQALKQAVKWQVLARNPTDAVDPPKPERKEMIALDADQTATLIERVRETSLYIPVLLAVTTGMRRGEVLALRWCDVDLDRTILSVVQTLETTRGGGLRFKPPKTQKSRRSISLPSIMVDALRKHRTVQAELYLRLGIGWDDRGLVCCRPTGNPINPNTLTSRFANLVRRTDIPKVRFHDLRHTHATHLLKEGVHPKVAQERLGHATIAVTLDLYSHVMPGMQEDAAIRVDTGLRAALRKRYENEI